jgi:hypothetical protein
LYVKVERLVTPPVGFAETGAMLSPPPESVAAAGRTALSEMHAVHKPRPTTTRVKRFLYVIEVRDKL